MALSHVAAAAPDENQSTSAEEAPASVGAEASTDAEFGGAEKAKPALAGNSWLRAYATGDIGGEARFFLPDYYETEAETVTREALASFLAAQNADVSSTDETRLRISYSVKVNRPSADGLPQSPVRLEPERAPNRDPARVDIDPTASGVRPAIAIGPRLERKDKQTSVRVTVYVLGDNTRLWSGFAEAELDDRSVAATARALTVLLTDYWGADAYLDGAQDEAAAH
ncbi:hypothetical protein [Hyphococcus sp.]|uniref:hypothetical protein n=1 Tax=Hyphococcus sp. TaxID=2038636 RepID=UPI0035C6FD7A